MPDTCTPEAWEADTSLAYCMCAIVRCASVPTCEVRSPKGHEPEALRASRELARAGFELRASRPRIRCPFSLLPPSPLVSPAGAFRIRIRESECESEFRIRAPCVRPPRGSEDQTFREVSASERWEAACIVRPGMTKTRAVCRAHSHSTFEVRSSKPKARNPNLEAQCVCSMHACWRSKALPTCRDQCDATQ